MNKNYQITDIKFKKNNLNRAKIYINDEFFIETNYSVIKELDIYIGKTISQHILDTIVRNDMLSKAKNDAIKFLSFRPRSEWEIQKKLQKKKYPSGIIDKAIKWLKDENLINDQEFSQEWIKYQINKKPAGKIKLRNELFKKRISRKIIDNVINTFFKQDEDELELAYKLIKKKERSLQSKKLKLEPHKIISLLKNQGFSKEIIEQVYNEIISQQNLFKQ